MDSPSGLLWCLSVKGSVHHWREKWATSAVHWLSSTLPPPNKTRSSWTTWRENSTYSSLRFIYFFCSFLRSILFTLFCDQGACRNSHICKQNYNVHLSKKYIYYIYMCTRWSTRSLCEACIHTYRHTPPAAHCPLSVHIVQLGNQLSHGWQRSLFRFLRLS